MARLHYKDPDTGQWVAIATEGPPGSDANVGAHEAALDPHPQYLTAAEAPQPGTVTPGQANTTASAVGTSLLYAREDHRHQVPTAAPVALGSAASAGVGSSLARADHVHPYPTAANVGAEASGAVATHAATAGHEPLSSTTPAALTPDNAGAVGVGTTAARADHVHDVPAAAPAASLNLNSTNAEGTGTSFARNDHSHSIQTISNAPNAVSGATGGPGTSQYTSRHDHVHRVDTGSPVALGSALADGVSNQIARADHVHPYPTAANVGAEASGAVASHAAAVDPHTGYVKKAGDTMSGNLTVAGTVTADIVSTNNLNDVAGIVMSPEPSAIAFWNATVTGLAPLQAKSLYLSDAPINPEDAARKSYVDASVPLTWTQYVPTYTGFTVSNQTCRYIKIRRTVIFECVFIIATVTGDMKFSLPFNAYSTSGFPGGNVRLYDTGTIYLAGAGRFQTTDFNIQRVDPATGGIWPCSPTAPFTWAAGDYVYVSGQYEATS